MEHAVQLAGKAAWRWQWSTQHVAGRRMLTVILAAGTTCSHGSRSAAVPPPPTMPRRRRPASRQPAVHTHPCCAALCRPAGQNVRKLVKDGFIIRKPEKIHSRHRARTAAEAKAKGRHTGYGASRWARRGLCCVVCRMCCFVCRMQVLSARHPGCAAQHALAPALLLPPAPLHACRPQQASAWPCCLAQQAAAPLPAAARRQAPRYARGAPAHQDPVDPPHARAAPPAQEVPGQQED